VAERAPAAEVQDEQVDRVGHRLHDPEPGLLLVPIPLAGDLNLPELALFKRDRRQGVVKLALTTYDAKSGALRSSQAPAYAFSHQTDWVVMLLVSWETNDLMPDPENDAWVGEGTFEGTPADLDDRWE